MSTPPLPEGWSAVEEPPALPEGWSLIEGSTPAAPSTLPEGWTPVESTAAAPAAPTAGAQPGVLERFDSFMRTPVAPPAAPAASVPPMTGPEDPTGGMTAQEAAAIDPVVKETAMRVGIPIAAMAAAPVSGGASIPLGLAALGGLTGEVLAQKSEMDRGAREQMSTGRMVAAPIVAGTPLGPTLSGQAAFVRGNLAVARPLAPLSRGAFGAGIQGGASVIEQGIDKEKIDWGDVMSSAAFGALFGAGLGAVESYQATRAQQAALLALRQRTGNFNGTDLEFMDWLRQNASARTAANPAAPATPPAPEALTANVPAAQPAPESAPLALPPAPPAPAGQAPSVTTLPTQGATVAPEPPTAGQGGSTPPPASLTAEPPAAPALPEGWTPVETPAAAAAPETVAPTPAAPPAASGISPPAPAPAAAETPTTIAGQPATIETSTQSSPVVAPTQASDRNVAKMADPKQFRVQKEYLVEAVQRLAKSASTEPTSAEVTIEVPGDGTFKVQNYQAALERFGEAVAKRFGKTWTMPKPSDWRSTEPAPIMQSPFSEAPGSRVAPKPSAVPPVKTKTSEQDRTAIAESAVSIDPTRPVLHHVLAEDGFSVSTDGRRMIVLTGGKGKTPEQIAKAVVGQDAKETAVKYPNWRQVTPDFITFKKGKIGIKRNAPQAFTVDTGAALKAVHQAKSVLDLNNRFSAIVLYDLGNGKVGFSASNPELGSYRSEGVTSDSVPSVALNAEWLGEALIAARQIGHQAVKLFMPSVDKPATIVGGTDFFAMILGKRVMSDPSATDSPAPVSPSPSLSVSSSSDPIGPKGPPPAAEVLRFPPLAELPRLSQAELSALEKLIVGRAEQGIVKVAPGKPTKPKGERLRFGSRPDGVVDIIDAIQDLRGVPRPPANARGGEWDGFAPTFRGPARILLASKTGKIDQWIKDELVAAYPQFAHLEGNPDGFYSAVTDALRERVKVQAAAQAEQRAAVKEQNFYDALIKPAKTGVQVMSDELNTGATFRRLGQKFKVTDVDENGNVTIKDGPVYGTQTVPPGTPLTISKDTLKNPQPSVDAMDWPDASPSGSGAAASPDFAGSPPVAAPPNQPPRNQPPPAADPNFSQLPIELPEAVQFFRTLSQGLYPVIRARLRVLQGNAAGVFYYKEGDPNSGRIELRADIFNLVSLAEKQELLRQAVAWAAQMKQLDPSINVKEAIRAKFNELVKQAEEETIRVGPRRALATFWHEIGHFLDFYPHGTTRRGNILGRLASLHNYMKGFLAKAPGIVAEPPNMAERAALRRKAEKELTDSVKVIIETIRREEPVYREIPLTAETITGIVKNLARDEFPEFYDWFSKQDRATKADVLRKAMKGLIDERVAKMGRREATGEVRVVEEQVTRRTGTEPTPEAIAQRYQELLREEFERRGLLNEKEIKAELSKAIAWWRGTKTIPDYFKPSVEMWADAMSIFFNNPRGLAERAPKFYQAFMQWMAVKPGIREEYDKLQRDIASGQIYKDRVADLRDMFTRDAEAGLLLDETSVQTTVREYLDTARLLFDRQFGPIERRIGRNPSDVAGQRALQALGNYRYRTTAWEAYALELRNAVEVPLAEANLSHLDMGEYMFHKRIVEGIYRNKAAPLGWNPKNSTERLAEMQRDLGPERWAALVKAQVAQREVFQKHVIRLLHESGTMSQALANAVDSEFFYAPFNQARVFTGGNTDAIAELIKVHHGNDAAGQIYGAVGNLGEIRNPYVQMQHRAFGLISMAYRQIALKRVVAWMRKNEPLSIADAPMRWNGNRLEPVRVENDRVTTLYLLNQGKVEAVYVPTVIGEMFKRGGVLEQRAIAASHALLGPPKMMLTELNPGFWPVAFSKDIWSAAVQLPGGARVLQNVPRAYLAAYRTFYGKPDPLAQRVLDRMMVTSRADSRGEHLGHADEMTRILLRLGKSPAQWNAEVGRIEQVLRLLWRGWAQQGQIFERTVKIAAMMAVDEAYPDMPEWLKQELVRERGGSPDFQAKGRAARIVELGVGLMFYNAWKEGMRSTKRAIAEDPRGFWSKFAATVGAAGLLLWAIENAIVGEGEEAEDLRDKLRSIPERDKLRGVVIPLGWVDKAAGKVAYIVLPFPDSLRWAHALQRKSLQSAAGQNTTTEGIGGFLNYQGQDVPGQNPWITTAKELWTYYVEGRNPYDEFTGRGALDETAVKAGEAGAELAKRSISNVTGGVVYRYRPERVGDTPTTMEEFLRAPVVANLIGRWVRVSSRGLDEYYANAKAPVEKEQASLRLVGEEMIGRSLKGEPWAREHVSLLGESEYLAKYIVDAAPRFKMQADSPFLRSLSQAGSTAEKLAIVRAENERQQAKLRRLDQAGRISNPIPLPVTVP